MEYKTKLISRRKFITMAAVCGSAACLVDWRKIFQNQPEPTKVTGIVMGTVVNLVLYGTNPEKDVLTAKTCLENMARLESIFSRFNPNSQLSLLNKNGVIHQPNPALPSLISFAQKISTESDGIFDISIKPLLDLYIRYAALNELPPKEEINNKLGLVGFQHINSNPDRISFDIPGMQITMDGIAKGYILDEAMSWLKQNEFEHVMLEAGGDLITTKTKYNDLPWNIQIAAPRIDIQQHIDPVSISQQSIATSGDYMQSFTVDFSEHHIIDPRSGHSAPFLSSASVIAPNTTLADCLATTLMLMDVEQGLSFIGQFQDCEALLIKKDMSFISTPGFNQIS